MPELTDVLLLGLAAGFAGWVDAVSGNVLESREQIAAQWQAQRVFEPAIGADQRADLMAQWQRAVTRSLSWASPA